jgi:hypothetical protein
MATVIRRLSTLCGLDSISKFMILFVAHLMKKNQP